MFSHDLKVRVRYSETDRMGYVYYGNYAQYYEIGRVETFRQLGFSYKELEDSGINMPVIDMRIKYLKPAVYDEELTVRTSILELPGVKINFEYEIFNEKDELLNIGKTTLAFFNPEKKRPCKAPEWMLDKLKPHFENG